MKAQDYPIAHFDFLSKLTVALETMPAQLLEHRYDYEYFGSWALSVRYSGNVINFSFDGKEYSLNVSYSSNRKPPYEFGSPVVVELPLEDGILSDLALEAVCEYIKLPQECWPAGAA